MVLQRNKLFMNCAKPKMEGREFHFEQIPSERNHQFAELQEPRVLWDHLEYVEVIRMKFLESSWILWSWTCFYSKACVGLFQESSGPELFLTIYWLIGDWCNVYLQVARCEVARLIRSVLIWSGPDVGAAIGGRSSGLFGDVLGPGGAGRSESSDSDARIEGKIGKNSCPVNLPPSKYPSNDDDTQAV